MQNKNQGWQRVLLIIIPYFVIVGLFQMIGMHVADVDTSSLHSYRSLEQDLVMALFGLFGTYAVLWIFTKYVDREPFLNLGFSLRNRLNEFFIGIGIGALIVASAYFLLLALGEIHFNRVVVMPEKLLKTILLFMIVALVEEAFMRGYILRKLMTSFHKHIALVLSSILFSIMHGFNPNIDYMSLASLFLAGLVLGGAYVYTQNLWFPIGLHLSWNLFQTHFGFNVSGKELYSLIEFNAPESNLLNGGAFGFEGSVLSIVAQIVLFIGILYFYENKKLITTTSKVASPSYSRDVVRPKD